MTKHKLPIFGSVKLVTFDTWYMNLSDCNVGARKRQNIRQHIFVLNAIMNNAVQGSKEALILAFMMLEMF